MITVLIYGETGLKNKLALMKGLLLKAYLRLHGCKVGRKLKCQSWPLFRSVPAGNIDIGNAVNIGNRITFDITCSGRLLIGEGVNLTQDILISAAKQVTIGERTLIGEQVCIRDADHGTALGLPMQLQPLNAEEVYLGSDVWIGAGCRILKGSRIADGAVIGANSVVLKKSNIISNGIYAGCPVRFLKIRCSLTENIAGDPGAGGTQHGK